MTIRTATIDDARAIAEVHVASWLAAYRGLVPDDVLDAQSVDARAAQWGEWLRKGETRTLLTGGVDGFVTFWETTGMIGALYVAPASARRGIGSALIDGAHAALHAAGHDEAYLWVFEANAPARAFYAATATFPTARGRCTSRTSHPRSGCTEPLRMSRCSGVDDTAIRLSNYFHVLRELVHLSCGHLALEPRFEVKALLADHLHDDARAVTKLRRRLDELRTPSEYPGAPSPELTALLDRAADAGTREYLRLAYGG